MTLPTTHLYLGFPLNNSNLALLEKTDLSLRALFIDSGEEYLQQIYFEGRHYLGKSVGDQVSLSQLRLYEVNIYSLLTKLFPHYSCQSTPLKLFSVVAESIQK